MAAMYAKQTRPDSMITIKCGKPQQGSRGRGRGRGRPAPSGLNLSQHVFHELRRERRRTNNTKALGEKDGFTVVGRQRSLKAMAKGGGARTKVTNRFSALNDNEVHEPVQVQRGPAVCNPRQPTGVWGARSSGLSAADAKKATVTLKKLLGIAPAPAPFAAEAAAAAAIAAECSKATFDGGKKVKSAHFADDVGKTLTETRIFCSEDPSNVGDLIPVSDEKELLHKSTNAWRPKCLKQPPRRRRGGAAERLVAAAAGRVLAVATVHELQAKLDADRAASSETKSWADLADEDEDSFWDSRVGISGSCMSETDY